MAELNYEPIWFVQDNLFKQVAFVRGMQNFVISKRDVSDYSEWLTFNDLYDVFEKPDLIKEGNIKILKSLYGN
jgi:hypothetical protein